MAKTRKLQLTTPVLAQHRPHSKVAATHLQCGLHSARDLRAGIRSTHKRGLRQTRSLPLTESAEDSPLQEHILHYTEVLNPTARTYTNQEVRALTSQPPLTHHIHKAQLKLFGHILRSHPNNIERNCCFTHSFQYRGGTVGAGLRPGRRRVHWTEQCTRLLWHWLSKSSRPPAALSPTFPFANLQAHRTAVDRQFWSTLVRLPTCKTLLEAHSYTVFSQT